jgi:hypothetical protein
MKLVSSVNAMKKFEKYRRLMRFLSFHINTKK